MIDATDNTPLQTAKRELKEETGYTAEEWIPLGTVHPSAGSTSEKIHLFAAKELYKQEQQLEATEYITIETFTVDKVKELIQEDKIQHGAGLAAFLRYFLRNGNDY